VQVVEKHRVKAVYLAPTAIRDMMAHGDEPVRRHDRSSLEVRPPHACWRVVLSWLPSCYTAPNRCVRASAARMTCTRKKAERHMHIMGLPRPMSSKTLSLAAAALKKRETKEKSGTTPSRAVLQVVLALKMVCGVPPTVVPQLPWCIMHHMLPASSPSVGHWQVFVRICVVLFISCMVRCAR
jgi:hypothetical protein